MVKHPSDFLEISVNGEPRRVPAGLHVRDLLLHLDVDPERVAVELNRRIVRQPEWTSTPVLPDAELEIVQFVGGG